MRDFQEFINEKIVVSFNSSKELDEFLELCDKNRLTWPISGSANNYNGGEKSVIGFNFHDNNKHLVYGDRNGLMVKNGWEVVPSSEFLKAQTTIEIFQSKQTVVCLKKQGGKVIARGIARCSKDDEFNFDYGSTLAFKRMLVDSKNKELMKDFVMPKSDNIQGDAVDMVLPKIKILKDGTKIIKQDKYEVGDVIVFKKDLIPIGCLRTAKITETSDVYLFRFGGIGWYSINRIKGKVIE